MAKWLAYFIMNTLVMIFCYLTNIIVVAFADELGELHGFLKYWQTWDDSLDPRFFVVGKVPKFLQYDYDKHYEEYEGTTPELEAVGRTRWFVKFKEGGEKFTFKEKVQRYFCRFLWLTRNNGYGFAFWFFGEQIDNSKTKFPVNKSDEFYGYLDNGENILMRSFVYKAHKHLFSNIYFDVFVGWKFGPGDEEICQAMIANRAVFSIG
jgi:hypothetical protein